MAVVRCHEIFRGVPAHLATTFITTVETASGSCRRTCFMAVVRQNESIYSGKVSIFLSDAMQDFPKKYTLRSVGAWQNTSVLVAGRF